MPQSFKKMVFSLFLFLASGGALSQAQELCQFKSGSSPRWASFENQRSEKGGAARENNGAKGHAFDSLKAGQTVVLMEHRGSGIIRRIWITISDRHPEMLRSLTLKIYWEGESKPAVLAPLGDFFAVSHGQMCAFESDVFSSPEGRSFNCIVPMPFRRGARVLLSNESNKDLSHLFYDVDFETLKKLPNDSLYFHCYWNRQLKTSLGQDFEILPQVRGKGRLLGVNVGVISSPDYEGSWWGEGEVKMYIDGDSDHPTMAGTGTEDYTGTAWGLGKFANRFQGCPVADPAKRMWSFYRFHIPDPVFFEKDLKVAIQTIGGTGADKIREFLKRDLPVKPVSVDQNGKFTRLLDAGAPKISDEAFPDGWVNFYRQDDYCAAAYFYLDKPSTPLPTLPSLETRVAKIK